ncbi:transcriptional regulator [Lacticaseibacillus chiayiensis]|uniref:Transcriptional regulator n=1 Tax=Lacticaseibacillus chiayiensis TaxID=2100821 RepID=A0A4V1P2C7_9LACO|nr:transcriptional regulator [Lacticaseibacillus chiayiensis]QVI35012.1 transcriptional regulator [Lacticaseibacillus chiayiensis]RXT27060.1 transcriptional regulator [Lacticaseibacillus chiayiensis]UYN56792.1 transcriptional regulator [Lacticaseibacillus chiayiensis]
MTDTKKLDALLKKYHTFVSGTARRYGISSSMLKHAVNIGRISREERGVYVEDGYTWDDFAVLAQRYTKGIFALDTALFLHGLTDQLPDRFIMAFPHGYRNPRLAEQGVVPIYYVSDRYFPGITTAETPNMGIVPVYSIERTILELWERADVAPYTRKEAINNYMYEYGNSVESYRKLKKLKEQLYPKSDIFKLLEVLN